MHLFLAIYETRHHGWIFKVISEKVAYKYANDENNKDVYPVEIRFDKLPHNFPFNLDQVAPWRVTDLSGTGNGTDGTEEFTITEEGISSD